ncbi:MAG: hypothetical protein Q9188_007041 [Gyalolechia gomerana]
MVSIPPGLGIPSAPPSYDPGQKLIVLSSIPGLYLILAARDAPTASNTWHGFLFRSSQQSDCGLEQANRVLYRPIAMDPETHLNFDLHLGDTPAPVAGQGTRKILIGVTKTGLTGICIVSEEYAMEDSEPYGAESCISNEVISADIIASIES